MRHSCPVCDDLKAEIAYYKSELGLAQELSDLKDLNKAIGLHGLTEARVLMHLMGSKAHTATRLQIAEHMGGESEDKAVDIYICRLRKRLGHDAFEPIYGEGYRLTAAGLGRINERLGRAPSGSQQDQEN